MTENLAWCSVSAWTTFSFSLPLLNGGRAFKNLSSKCKLRPLTHDIANIGHILPANTTTTLQKSQNLAWIGVVDGAAAKNTTFTRWKFHTIEKSIISSSHTVDIMSDLVIHCSLSVDELTEW